MVVKEFRLKKGITQEQLAESTGITRAQISKIETGVSKPSVRVAKKIGKTLSFDWTKIFAPESE